MGSWFFRRGEAARRDGRGDGGWADAGWVMRGGADAGFLAWQADGIGERGVCCDDGVIRIQSTMHP